MNKTLYTELVDITTDYLGPAADRFMTRHIEAHLQIKPAEITRDQLLELTDWLQVSMSLLTTDKKVIDNFNSRIKELIK